MLLECPHLVDALDLAASEVVDDFEDQVRVLPTNERSEFDASAAIGRLTSVRDESLEHSERRRAQALGAERTVSPARPRA